MLSILYEDNHIIVVIKPAGLESQSGKSFAPDMVSEIRKHLASHPQDIHKLTKETSTASKYPQPPYVGVIHRLDRPVSGIMVYAKNPKAAASLSTSLQQGKIEKWYQAVICGKPVDNNGTYVDYLKQDKKNNCSRIVDKSDPDGKRAERSDETGGRFDESSGERSCEGRKAYGSSEKRKKTGELRISGKEERQETV